MELLLAARLSRTADGQTGITTQDQDARRWAQEHGHTIVATAADKISGKISPFQRKNLGPWLKEPELMRQYQGICASKMDRFTRRRDWDIRQWAEDNGKVLIITQFDLMWPPKPGDIITPQMWDMLVNQSVGELTSISQRYDRMHNHLADNGYVAGGSTLFGYRLIKEDGGFHKLLEPDPAMFRDGKHVIELMADKYLEGWTLTAIGNWLDSEGIQPPGKATIWRPQTISQMLRSPTISGRKKNYGRTMKVQPVLGITKQRQVIAKMESAGHRRGTPTGETALLTSILHCLNCERPMYRNSSRGGRKTYRTYYHCRPKDGQSCHNMVPLNETDALVDFWYSRIYGYDEPYVEFVTIPGDDHADELYQNSEDIKALDIDDPAYDQKLGDLRTERKRLQALPPEPPKKVERTFTKPDGTPLTFLEHWHEMDTAAKRDWLMERDVRMFAGELKKAPGRKVLIIEGKLFGVEHFQALKYPVSG